MKLFGVYAAASLIGISSSLDINVRENFNGDDVVRIKHEDMSQELYGFLQNLGVDDFGSTGDAVDFRLTQNQISQLEIMGVDFNYATEEWLSRFETNFRNQDLFCEGDDCGRQSLDAFYSQYQSLDAIQTRIEDLVESNPNAELKVIGQSFEGRDLKVVEIGNDGSKPIAMVFCNIHAREWTTPLFCTYLIEQMTINPDPLLDSFTLAIFPTSNPDGYEYSRTTDNLWRKTRMKYEGERRCIGVDGNRNWDNNHCGVGSSTNPCSQTYCGQSPFDQPEVAALDNYAKANLDRAIAAIDIHSYGGYMIHPFGYTPVLPPGEDLIRMVECARDGADAAGEVDDTFWAVGTTPQVLGYQSGGTSKDYLYGNLDIVYAYTVELRGPGFQPPTSNIMPSNLEAFGLVKATLECVQRIDIDGIGASPTAFPTNRKEENVPEENNDNGNQQEEEREDAGDRDVTVKVHVKEESMGRLFIVGLMSVFFGMGIMYSVDQYKKRKSTQEVALNETAALKHTL